MVCLEDELLDEIRADFLLSFDFDLLGLKIFVEDAVASTDVVVDKDSLFESLEWLLNEENIIIKPRREKN